MQGFIVKHKKLGIGKIIDFRNRRLTIHFIDGKNETLGSDVLKDGWITRTNLENGHTCAGPDGECTITQVHPLPSNTLIPCQYEVTYAEGLRASVSEVDLVPLATPIWQDALTRFKALAIQNNHLFQSRERLLKSFAKMLREGAGLRALLSSRIDLHAHQAYVAGRVLLDSTRRYLLADEVGLGKTIEAGIVISDLLSQKPDAQILILCPAPLTQQWFCELYSKFGGQIFTLLDLGGRKLTQKQVRKSICSITRAAYDIPDFLAEIPWDMIVVDEVHQLLAAPAIYNFVHKLSGGTSSLLLLSAVPAQRREDDFLQLLALLEPDRYGSESAVIRSGFQVLYEAQSDIGRRLRMLSNRIDRMADDDPMGEKVIEFAPRLLQLPGVESDANVFKMVEGLELGSSELPDRASELIHYVADNYRINRRILRNRRQRLYEAGQLTPINRQLVPHPYSPDSREIELINGIEALIDALRANGLPVEHLAAFTRLVIQSLVLPITALTFLEGFQEEFPGTLNQQGRDYISIGYMFGYQDWDLYAGLVWKAARSFAPADLLSRCLAAAEVWYSRWPSSSRATSLLALLRTKKSQKESIKLIIFAGFPGAARQLFEFLEEELGEKQVTSFFDELEQEIKEENARAFQTKPNTWVLVSDESGGEGRNFQFADEIIHFDTPWYAARIEQRIGRLDRLGREKYRKDVLSNVLFCSNSKEASVVRCYAEGLQVYERSISGLEFALRDVESLIASAASQNDTGEISALIPRLAALAEQERASDESEAVLDEASFEAKGAERFRRVSDSSNSTLDLEKHFVEYFRAITVPKSTKEVSESGFPKGVWRFFADDTRFEPLTALDKNSEGLFGEYRGTFHRGIAQRRAELQFFNVGNPFFDSVISSLNSNTTGRTFAIAAIDPSAPSWTGLKLIFTAQPDFEVLAGNYGLINQATNLFTLNRKIVFLDINGIVASTEVAKPLNDIHGSLSNDQKNRTWWNLTNEKAKYILEAMGSRGWTEFLQQSYEVAEAEARKHFQEKLTGRIQLESDRIREQRRQLESRIDSGAIRESMNLHVLSLAISQWRVELDSIGFLSVNGIDIR